MMLAPSCPVCHSVRARLLCAASGGVGQGWFGAVRCGPHPWTGVAPGMFKYRLNVCVTAIGLYNPATCSNRALQSQAPTIVSYFAWLSNPKTERGLGVELRAGRTMPSPVVVLMDEASSAVKGDGKGEGQPHRTEGGADLKGGMICAGQWCSSLGQGAAMEGALGVSWRRKELRWQEFCKHSTDSLQS